MEPLELNLWQWEVVIRGDRNLGHRYHMLGHKEDLKETKVGMGFAVGSDGKNYFCLLTK
jgi:hypothetical protein